MSKIDDIVDHMLNQHQNNEVFKNLPETLNLQILMKLTKHKYFFKKNLAEVS